jgi:hypothetical protein
MFPFLPFVQARSSVGERFLDTEEVGSSILPVPTSFFLNAAHGEC